MLGMLAVLALGPRPAWAAQGAPTASIGTFDCRLLQVELTLDNTRSTRPTSYGYGASFLRPLHRPYGGADDTAHAEVAAGGTRVVSLPLRDDARTDVTVYLPDGGHVTSRGACGNAPGATFDRSDCEALRMGVALDNSGSQDPTRYRWVLSDPAGTVRAETVEVDAGDVADVPVPLIRGSWVVVQVSVAGKGLVATSDRRTCGRYTLDPRASFGAVDCTDVSASLVLDNTRSSARARVHLPGPSDAVLEAGETRSLRLHLPISRRVAVTADEVAADGIPADLDALSTARCAVVANDGAPETPSVTPAPATSVPTGAALAGAAPESDQPAGGSPGGRPLGWAAAAVALVALLVVAARARRRRP
jgi:hypothetical protein